ncbi:GTP-binding protein Di-Ras1-like [Tubulanus polymorphus]|uniref:GTP-binding protein Di-Ras1-like n=1 Tax=Tubulanus polymorphus TaxID=672921 RepID=UPI003DA3E0E7
MSCYRKKPVKVVLMGAAAVGKTCIVQRFMFDKFPEEHKRTIEDNHQCEFSINNSFRLDILDTTGSYQFPAMRKLAITKGEIFFIVFAINELSTFEQVSALREEIIGIKSDAHIIIVGNKFDRVEWQLDFSFYEETVHDWGHELIKTSAKNNVNVTELFRKCIPSHVQNELVLYCQLPPSKRYKRRETVPIAMLIDATIELKKSRNRFLKNRPKLRMCTTCIS